MSGDEKLRERFVEAYLHDARPVPVILKELGVSKVQARAWRQSEGLNRARRQRSLVDKQYQQVVALVESGRSVLSAIEEVGFPQSLAYRYLAQDGLELVRGNRGGTAQHDRDRIAQALKLVNAGKSYKQAGQVVDRSADTVKAWHHDRMSGRLILNDHPTESESKVGRGKRLIRHDRIEIAYLLKQGHTHREIAAQLGRNQSTISREITRGMTEHGYDALVAQKRAVGRLARPKPRKLDTNPQLRAFVIEGLNSKWSPEQISNFLARCFGKGGDMSISHETIYQALYIQAKGALRQELKVEKALRSGRTGRKPQSHLPARSNRSWIGNDYRISKRPASVEDRAVPGHWEGDLIIGQGGTTALVTCVERSTRYTMIRKLDVHDSATTVDKLIEMFTGKIRNITKTLTWDQGAELAQVDRLSIERGLAVYFCDPHSPWQRPTNENTNGLVRDFLPKGSEFSSLTDKGVQQIQDLLNGRPRKVLNWYTPEEKIQELFK